MIPLIRKNNWRTKDKTKSEQDTKETNKDNDSTELSLQEKAAREIIAESAKELEDWENRGGESGKQIDEVRRIQNILLTWI